MRKSERASLLIKEAGKIVAQMVTDKSTMMTEVAIKGPLRTELSTVLTMN